MVISPLLGVCSWSLDRHDILRAIEAAGAIPQLRAVQIGFFTEATVGNADPPAIARAASNAGLQVVSTFVAFDGEDYSSIRRIAETGGFARDEKYAQRKRITQKVAAIAGELGAGAVAIHAGTVPEDPAHPAFDKLATRCREVADLLVNHRLQLHLETGRESADALLRFLDAVARENVAVNFDPANFVVYGTDDPARSFRLLADRVRVIHLKDACRSAQPGVVFGRPAALGTGDAGIPRLVSKSRVMGNMIPLLIECGSRDTGADAVRAAAEYVQSLLS